MQGFSSLCNTGRSWPAGVDAAYNSVHRQFIVQAPELPCSMRTSYIDCDCWSMICRTFRGDGDLTCCSLSFRYIRIVGTHNTVNKVFHLVSFECMFTHKSVTLERGLIGKTQCSMFFFCDIEFCHHDPPTPWPLTRQLLGG